MQATHGGSDNLSKSDSLALAYIDVSFVGLDAIGHNGLPGFKPFRLTPLNSRKQPRNSKGLTDCAHYFDHLSNFVLDGLGPAYQASSLISDELYAAWLSIVNQPNCKPEIRRPDRNDFPYPVLWYGFIPDGKQYVKVKFPEAEYPALFERLSQLAESPKSKCTLNYMGPSEHPCSSWYIRLYELLENIALINSIDQTAKPIPLLGIDREECTSTDPTVQARGKTPDACVYSTGTIDDLGFTVYTRGYDPQKQDWA